MLAIGPSSIGGVLCNHSSHLGGYTDLNARAGTFSRHLALNCYRLDVGTRYDTFCAEKRGRKPPDSADGLQ